MGMGEGTQALADIAELEQLAEQLSQSYAGATMDDVDLDTLARQLGDEAAVDARDARRAGAGAGQPGLPGPRLRRAVAAVAEGDAPARQDRAARCGTTAFGPARRARHPAGRRGRRADGRDAAVAVRRHRAVERHPHADQRRAAPGGHGRGGATDSHHRRRRRGVRDRDPHPGRGGAAGRHVVLDGDGGPLAADEAHRAGAAPSGQHAVPLGCAADHRLRPLRAGR